VGRRLPCPRPTSAATPARASASAAVARPGPAVHGSILVLGLCACRCSHTALCSCSQGGRWGGALLRLGPLRLGIREGSGRPISIWAAQCSLRSWNIRSIRGRAYRPSEERASDRATKERRDAQLSTRISMVPLLFVLRRRHHTQPICVVPKISLTVMTQALYTKCIQIQVPPAAPLDCTRTEALSLRSTHYSSPRPAIAPPTMRPSAGA
jgi:hypothetical protein